MTMTEEERMELEKQLAKHRREEQEARMKVIYSATSIAADQFEPDDTSGAVFSHDLHHDLLDEWMEKWAVVRAERKTIERQFQREGVNAQAD